MRFGLRMLNRPDKPKDLADCALGRGSTQQCFLTGGALMGRIHFKSVFGVTVTRAVATTTGVRTS